MKNGEQASLKVSLALLLFLYSLYLPGISEAVELRVVTLDVGMGQSVLLEEDGHGLLIDTGLADQAPHVLARMKEHGVHTLDYLLLTHLHPDHAGGYPMIRKSWPDTPVLDNCHVPDASLSNAHGASFAIHAALEQDALHGCLAAGDIFQWQGHRVEVLWPLTLSGNDRNANSLVLLLVSEEGRTVLLMGDVDRSVERRLATGLKSSLQGEGIDLYVAAHHAAADSTDDGFLRMLQPKSSLVSVGQGNRYGYPAAAALDVLERFSGTVLRTDEEGEICFTLDGEGLSRCRVLPDES